MKKRWISITLGIAAFGFGYVLLFPSPTEQFSRDAVLIAWCVLLVGTALARVIEDK